MRTTRVRRLVHFENTPPGPDDGLVGGLEPRSLAESVYDILGEPQKTLL